ncbi:MAG: hypothetical protein GX675_02910 [Erysipelotrichaceae bacterium]|nr:hypothetical protein [Erysipelotrichaceae bacterium]
MFKKTEKNIQVLSKEECIDILQLNLKGVLAVYKEDGSLFAFHFNHIYLDGKLYFYVPKSEYNPQVIEDKDSVSFNISDGGFDNKNNWASYTKNVIIFGIINNINKDDEKLEILRQIFQNDYSNSIELEKAIKQKVDTINILELSINKISGKIESEKLSTLI